MADGVRIRVRRKDELLRKLERLAPAARQELTAANKRSAEEMVGYARQFAPVRTGRLRDSIVATPPGQTPPDHSQGARIVPPGAYMVTAGNSRVRYAHLVEFGAAPHTAGGRFAGARHPGAPRQPFFFPAYRLIRKRHKSRAGRAIGKSIRAVARR